MQKWNRRYVLAGADIPFAGFIAPITLLARRQLVGTHMDTLVLVALFGLYAGFGVLVMVYRLILKLDQPGWKRHLS